MKIDVLPVGIAEPLFDVWASSQAYAKPNQSQIFLILIQTPPVTKEPWPDAFRILKCLPRIDENRSIVAIVHKTDGPPFVPVPGAGLNRGVDLSGIVPGDDGARAGAHFAVFAALEDAREISGGHPDDLTEWTFGGRFLQSW